MSLTNMGAVRIMTNVRAARLQGCFVLTNVRAVRIMTNVRAVRIQRCFVLT